LNKRAVNILINTPINQALYFAPRSRYFWGLHCCFLLIYSFPQTLRYLFNIPETADYYLMEGAISLVLFTFLIFCFRWLYKKRLWINYAISKQITLAVITSLLMTPLFICCLSVLMFPFFVFDMLNTNLVEIGDVSFDVNNRGVDVHASGYTRNAYDNYIPLGLFSFNKLISTMFSFLFWITPYLAVSISRRMKQNEVDNLQLENNLKEAQLLSLSSQLNPHFLFNSLNNIRFMIHENQQKADDIIVSLSEILRYSLVQGKQEKTTLKQELAIVQQYIEIVSLQLESRLDFQLSMSLKSNNILLPPMIIQLLIENAIKHGIDNIKDTSQLTLNIFQVKQKLVIKVTNPIAANITDKESTGIGLANIRQRLVLLYGDQATLVTEQEHEFFHVTLTLPFEQILGER
jgi:sensor histidine kinase YesM